MQARSQSLSNLSTIYKNNVQHSKVMQPIQINVQVTIGMDSALTAMLTGLIGNRQEAAPVAVAAPARKRAEAKPKQVEEPTAPANEKPVEARREEMPTNDAAQEAEKPAAETEPVAETPAEATEYTEADVRAAMNRTRQRIEGEDYKEKTDSEGYKTWHKRLTAWFKNTAAICGAEKPSLLPDSDSRAAFIACCDRVEIKGDELTEGDCPF